MGVMDRLRGKLRSLGRASHSARARDDELVASSGELTYFFVASNDAALVEAYYELFRAGAPAYGGAASRFRAGHSTLELREQNATLRHIGFDGESAYDGRVETVSGMADALATLRSVGGSDEAQVAYAVVGRRGADWVREVHATVMGAAVEQMSPLFRMISTRDEAAAGYVRDSLRDVTVPSSSGVVASARAARRGRPAPAFGTT